MKTTDKIADIIRALLMKTVENGATEAEAMSAAAKAYELLGKYQLDMTDVDADPIKTDDVAKSRRGSVSIAKLIMNAVGAYCDCIAWTQSGEPKFTGRDSNILFATWLLDALDGFCARRIIDYAASLPMGRNRTGQMQAFKSGLVSSICERLWEAVKARPASERHKIQQANLATLTKNGVTLYKSQSKTKIYRQGSAFQAGRAIGQTATFNRPVNGNRGALQIAS
ncbi:MAG: DUF2786 domain-containing protein [Bradyrhizobium sp.]|nr:DUF2786 domain-containing protein [Bradyrhizobium sp.]